MIILNNGPVPVRVAGRWLQPGESMPVESLEVAYRLMAANPDVVEPGKEPEKAASLTSDNKPTEDMQVVGVEPSTTGPTKRKK